MPDYGTYECATYVQNVVEKIDSMPVTLTVLSPPKVCQVVYMHTSKNQLKLWLLTKEYRLRPYDPGYELGYPHASSVGVFAVIFSFC